MNRSPDEEFLANLLEPVKAQPSSAAWRDDRTDPSFGRRGSWFVLGGSLAGVAALAVVLTVAVHPFAGPGPAKPTPLVAVGSSPHVSPSASAVIVTVSPAPTPHATASPHVVPTATPHPVTATPGPPSGTPVVVATLVTEAPANGPGVIKSSPVNTTGNEYLVAFLEAGNPGSGGQQRFTSVTAPGLTWTMIVVSNSHGGTTEVWGAPAPAALSNVVVTADMKLISQGLLVIDVIRNIDGVTPFGAYAIAGGGATQAPSAALTPQKSGSLVLAAGNDWYRDQSRTPGTGQVMVHQFIEGVYYDTFWVQRLSAPVAAGTPITMGDALVTGNDWNFLAVELRGAS